MSHSREVLVTGATGFIGGALVRELLRRKIRVRALGRNLARGLQLQAAGAEFRPVNLVDKEAMLRACEGVEVVVHVGALASPWGRPEDYEAANVTGTRNVIDACVACGVSRLVYVSSPSVLSKFRDQFDLSETQRPTAPFVSLYSQTKWEGELLVEDAQKWGLETVIIRPKAVYGPGDRTIFPRLIEAARRRGLPRIGDGETVTNITYIDDVVAGLLSAMERPEAVGNTYVLTGGEDVRIWDVVERVLNRVGCALGKRTLSVQQAMAMALGLEQLWKRLRLRSEPPLTRYTVGIFAYSQTYDISAARRDLGYEPKVSVEEGIERFLEVYDEKGDQCGSAVGEEEAQNSQERKPPRTVDCKVYSAGVCHAPGRLFFPEGQTGQVDVPALFAQIEHPENGTILFDTGYSERFFEATRAFPARLMRYLTPATVDESTTALGRLRTAGVAPEEVRFILLSHFDPDHYGGLRDFPEAQILCTAEAWESVRGKEGLAALRVRLLPGHLPEDISARLVVLPRFSGPPVGPFASSHDVFGDGSIIAVMLPGHAPGQFGVFVHRSGGERPLFLAADGCWTRQTLTFEKPKGRAHRLLAVDRGSQEKTYRLLRRLHLEMPEVVIVPSHCPEAAAELDVEIG